MNNFTIIIPIYNESDSIFNLVDEINKEFNKFNPEILIVNDVQANIEAIGLVDVSSPF